MKRVHLRQVQIGLRSSGLTEIVTGLDEGEQVVAAGQFNLTDNDLVVVVDNRNGPRNKS